MSETQPQLGTLSFLQGCCVLVKIGPTAFKDLWAFTGDNEVTCIVAK